MTQVERLLSHFLSSVTLKDFQNKTSEGIFVMRTSCVSVRGSD